MFVGDRYSARFKEVAVGVGVGMVGARMLCRRKARKLKSKKKIG